MAATLEQVPVQLADDRAGFDQMANLLRAFAGWMRSRQSLIEISYLIPERGGLGWYVVTKEPVFNYELNKQLSEFGASLIRKGFAIHAILLPGSAPAMIPTDGIAISPTGRVETYA